ncbi:hypothetical protein pb186bvf_000903 [Paramecium bursaria]
MDITAMANTTQNSGTNIDLIKSPKPQREYILKQKVEFSQFFVQSSSGFDDKIILLSEAFKLGQIIEDDQALAVYERLQFRKNKKNWVQNEKGLFVWVMTKLYALDQYSAHNIPQEVWEFSSQYISKSPSQLKNYWYSLSKISISQTPWTFEEDHALFSIINKFKQTKYQNKWGRISVELEAANISNVFRSGRHCRERWINHLDPELQRQPWSTIDCIQMINLVNQNGRRWAIIAKLMNRNENQVKNKFNSLIRKYNTIEQVEDVLTKKNKLSGIFIPQPFQEENQGQGLEFGLVNRVTKDLFICDLETIIKFTNSKFHQRNFVLDSSYIVPFDSQSYDYPLNDG